VTSKSPAAYITRLRHGHPIGMFFHDWASLGRIIVLGILSYLAMIATIRIIGKRSLSKFDAFDFIITVALGSLLANIMVSKNLTLADGVVAIIVLLGVQHLMVIAVCRWQFFENVMRSEPSLLFYRGQFLGEMMHKEKVTEEDVISAMRMSGISAMEDVEAVVLERDGTLSAMRKQDLPATTLKDVQAERHQRAA
jgi:uncharacterized membrane protein YcaP (DUF421 family)